MRTLLSASLALSFITGCGLNENDLDAEEIAKTDLTISHHDGVVEISISGTESFFTNCNMDDAIVSYNGVIQASVESAQVQSELRAQSGGGNPGLGGGPDSHCKAIHYVFPEPNPERRFTFKVESEGKTMVYSGVLALPTIAEDYSSYAIGSEVVLSIQEPHAIQLNYFGVSGFGGGSVPLRKKNGQYMAAVPSTAGLYQVQVADRSDVLMADRVCDFSTCRTTLTALGPFIEVVETP